MIYSFNKRIMSGTGGTFVTFLYLIISNYLDKFINPKYSNMISLLISATINFLLQSYTFLEKHTDITKIIHKYLISEVIILSLSQLGVIYFLDNKNIFIKFISKRFQKYYNSFVRIIVASLIFLLVSFPLRKNWFFI